MRYPLIEGFDYYASVSTFDTSMGAMNTRWNMPGSPESIQPGLGGDGQSVRVTGGFGSTRFEFPFDPVNKLTCHFAMKITLRSSFTSREFLQFKTTLGVRQWGLGFDAAGRLLVYGEGDVVVATGNIPFITNQVYRCCLSADLSGAGKFRLSINGEEDMGLHSDAIDIQDDSSNLMGLISFGNAGPGSGSDFNYLLDDVVVGIDECVDWGPLEVNTLPPTADVAVAWTRSAGATNFSNVDDLPFTIDTDYNSSSTVGQKDVFAYADAPHTPESVLAVQVMTLARKEESAVRKFREIIRIGGVDYNGTEHILAESYGHWFSTWILNPATGLAWTAAEINALQGGYEYTV